MRANPAKRDNIEIAGVSVKPGSRQSIDIPLPSYYTHSSACMPIHVVHGRHPGPCLLVCAAIHGDELNGVEIVRRILGHKLINRINGTLIAIDQFVAPKGEFRSNLHRGGTSSLIKITPEERSTAVRAARIMGLNVAGVDLLRSNHGPVVMEVNSSPGLEGIEGATGKDVAGMMISYLEKSAPGKTKTRGKG